MSRFQDQVVAAKHAQVLAKVFGAYWFALIVSVSAVALLIYAADTDSQVGRSMS
jgi:hypothetical protein